MTYGHITEEALAKLRTRIGDEQPIKGAWVESITRDATRHFAQAIGDPNPLWADEAYGKKTSYGNNIAPPCLLYCCSSGWMSGVTGLPGVHVFWSGDDWEWYEPVKVGDTIKATTKLLDAVEKRSSFAGKTVLATGQQTYYNQKGTVVAITKSFVIRAEREAAKQRQKYGDWKKHRSTEEELKQIERDYDAEQIRGAKPRYWDDVAIGDTLTPVVKGPLVLTDILAWFMTWGSRWVQAHRFMLDYRRRHPEFGALNPELNVLDTPERVHWEDAYAREVGFPAAYDLGPQRVSWLGHCLTNWMGDDGFLKTLSIQARLPNIVGDTTWVRGKVEQKYIKGGEHLVDVSIWAESQRGMVTMNGKATVSLPSRSAGSR